MSSIPNPKLVRHNSEVEPEQEDASSGVRWWWIAVPALVAVMLAVLAIVLTLRNQDLQDTLKNSERMSAQQVTEIANARRMLETLSAPGSLHVNLTAPANRQPTAEAVYQRDRGRLVLIASNLAPLTPGHVYQLWLMPANNTSPLSAGIFAPDERGHASMFTAMPPNMKTSGFAVTIEPAGGATSPTTKPILLGTTQ